MSNQRAYYMRNDDDDENDDATSVKAASPRTPLPVDMERRSALNNWNVPSVYLRVICMLVYIKIALLLLFGR